MYVIVCVCIYIYIYHVICSPYKKISNMVDAPCENKQTQVPHILEAATYCAPRHCQWFGIAAVLRGFNASTISLVA
jgi:hypothetical protein